MVPCRCSTVVMPVMDGSVLHRVRALLLLDRAAVVVIRATKRHGRCGSTLRGNRQHQQPYE